MTEQCTECLGYHGQSKPCPAVKEIRLKDACDKCGSNWTTEKQRERIRAINRKTYERLVSRIKELESALSTAVPPTKPGTCGKTWECGKGHDYDGFCGSPAPAKAEPAKEKP